MGFYWSWKMHVTLPTLKSLGFRHTEHEKWINKDKQIEQFWKAFKKWTYTKTKTHRSLFKDWQKEKKTQWLSPLERSIDRDKERFSDLETSIDTNTPTQIMSLRNQ